MKEIAKKAKINEISEMSFDKILNEKSDEIIGLNFISNKSSNEDKCSNCENKWNIELKKFKQLDEQINLDEIDDNFARCSCGKRHIDIVMAQVLKIMKEENIEFKRFILRNGPIPLISPMFNNNRNEPYIGKKSLIIIDPRLTNDIAKRIIKEVSEVKGVIKGNPNDTVGFLDNNSEAISYELLEGSDFRCDIVRSPVGEIAINKIQHLSYLEFPPSMENKIERLWNYIQSKKLSKEEISNMTVIDGTCGNGTLGIFLLKLGVKKVIFNDIWKPATIMTSINLKANGFMENKDIKYGENDYNTFNRDSFEIYNLAFEELPQIFSNETNNEYNKYNEYNYNENKENKEKNGNNKNNRNNGNNKSYKSNKTRNNATNPAKFDLCILDCFPGSNTKKLEEMAELLAKDTLII